MSNKTLTEAQARALADEIKSNLVELDKNLKYFYAVQGWLPLGYDSFTTWWDNEMRELPFSKAIRNWAVYMMIDENTEGTRIRPGMTAVMAHAAGLKPTTITSMKHKQTLRARPKTRFIGKRDEDPAVVSVIVPTRWHRHILALSVAKDAPMSTFLRPIIKEGMMRHYGIDLEKPLHGNDD